MEIAHHRAIGRGNSPNPSTGRSSVESCCGLLYAPSLLPSQRRANGVVREIFVAATAKKGEDGFWRDCRPRIRLARFTARVRLMIPGSLFSGAARRLAVEFFDHPPDGVAARDGPGWHRVDGRWRRRSKDLAFALPGTHAEDCHPRESADGQCECHPPQQRVSASPDTIVSRHNATPIVRRTLMRQFPLNR